MDEVLKVSGSELSPADSRKWISRIVIAVVLGEAMWGFLVSITNYLVLPAMATLIGGDPQSFFFRGRGDFNVPALFASGLELCLAGIMAFLLNSWSEKSGRVRSEPVRLTPVAAPRLAPVVAPAANPLATPAVAAAVQANASVTSMQPAPRPAQPSPQVAKPARPKPPKEVHYNIVGEPVDDDE
jgi:hypothetical protein